MVHKICFIFIIILLVGSNHNKLISQENNINIPDNDSLVRALKSLITKNYYEDPNIKIKIIFDLKIYPSGEVRSANVMRSENLKCKMIFSICDDIENKFNLKFMYDLFKHEDPKSEYGRRTYVYWGSPALKIDHSKKPVKE